MSDNIFFSIPCKPSIKLRLKKDKLTFYNDYCGRNVLSAKSVAQIGFDLCESIGKPCIDINKSFKTLSGITLSEDMLAHSKYAPVETKVFGIISENTAVYSLGILLRDLLISTGRSDTRMRAILDKACDQYSFMRYNSFRELKEDLGIYLKTEVDEEIYGVVIASDKPLPEPIFKHAHTEKPVEEREEAVNFKPYSTPQEVWHKLSKHLTPLRIKAALFAFFIIFSSISIPVTSVKRSHDIPTMAIQSIYNK